MPITMQSARQYPLVAEVTITWDDITSGAVAKAIEVPAGAVVTNVEFLVKTEWNSATSAVITKIGDGVDDDRYYAAGTFNLKTAAGFLQGTGTSPEALITGYKYPTADSIDIVITTSGATSAGVGILRVTYIISETGRAHEVQPVNGNI
jgi:hypothetical protein